MPALLPVSHKGPIHLDPLSRGGEGRATGSSCELTEGGSQRMLGEVYHAQCHAPYAAGTELTLDGHSDTSRTDDHCSRFGCGLERTLHLSGIPFFFNF